jgi:hypothetical protein
VSDAQGYERFLRALMPEEDRGWVRFPIVTDFVLAKDFGADDDYVGEHHHAGGTEEYGDPEWWWGPSPAEWAVVYVDREWASAWTETCRASQIAQIG